MFLHCVLLVFLVLLQLPKKEAGEGMAFGGAATDALFGAGSGNVLTKITKYVAGIFFGLAIFMAFLAAHKPISDAAALTQQLLQRTAAPLAPATQSAPSTSSGAASASPPPGGVSLQLPSVAPAPAPSASTNK